MAPISYNRFVNSAQFFSAQRIVLARRAVLLTPLECADPSSIPISILNAPITLLESALTSHFQIAENTATLSLLECALTRLSPVTPLEFALPKNTRGGGRSSQLRAPRSPTPPPCFVFKLLPTLSRFFALFCIHTKLNSFLFKRFRTLCQKNGGWGGVLSTWTIPIPSNRKLPHLPCASPAILRDAGSCSMSQNSTEEFLPLSDTFDEG